MKRIQIGDLVRSDYGKGKVVAVTKEWLVHDNSSNGSDSEFAILRSEDSYEIIKEPELHSQ